MNSATKELRRIPGVGKVIARDLQNIGISSVADLRGKDPEKLYEAHNRFRGAIQDRCMLYVMRCAVYFAETEGKRRDPRKLKWWKWKDHS